MCEKSTWICSKDVKIIFRLFFLVFLFTSQCQTGQANGPNFHYEIQNEKFDDEKAFISDFIGLVAGFPANDDKFLLKRS